jgi:hypothetical protein
MSVGRESLGEIADDGLEFRIGTLSAIVGHLIDHSAPAGFVHALVGDQVGRMALRTDLDGFGAAFGRVANSSCAKAVAETEASRRAIRTGRKVNSLFLELHEDGTCRIQIGGPTGGGACHKSGVIGTPIWGPGNRRLGKPP